MNKENTNSIMKKTQILSKIVILNNNDLLNKLDKTENLIILQIMPLEVINYQFYYLAEVIEKSKFKGDLPN
jgi:hypothetical protein